MRPKRLYHLDIPKNITLTHEINGIILMGPNEQEEARMLEALLRNIHSRVGEINLKKILEPTMPVYF